MAITFAFDVYGTLIDTHGLVSMLEDMFGANQAKQFSHLWREKQLEYSFRRALMDKYENFSVCTSQALDYTSSFYKVNLSNKQKCKLLSCYRTLPLFDDVIVSLEELKNENVKLFAFSNGCPEALEALLKNTQVWDFFDGIVSADDIKTFKPNPDIYEYLLANTKSSHNSTWLISSNSFDVIGAVSAGLHSAWLQRSENQIFDPWGIDPTITINSLLELKKAILVQQQVS